MTTIENLTNEQLSTLQDEARAACDAAQAQLCEEALCGHLWARVKCLAAINYAETQAADSDGVPEPIDTEETTPVPHGTMRDLVFGGDK